jgi:hypothetical protein
LTYYATTIYETYIGLDPVTSRILAAATGTEYFIVSWIAVFAVEQFGHRTLMIFGSCGCAGSMAILAGTNFMSQNNKGGAAPGIVSVVCLFMFNTFFAIAWLGMTWLYPQISYHFGFAHVRMVYQRLQTGSSTFSLL